MRSPHAMKLNLTAAALALAALACSCGGKTGSDEGRRMSKLEQTKYERAQAKLKSIYTEAEQVADAPTADALRKLGEDIRHLGYDFNSAHMPDADRARCQALKDSIRALRDDPDRVFRGRLTFGALESKTAPAREVECKRGAPGARAVEEVRVEKVFDEPKKIGLRATLKAMLSGKPRSVAAIPVPKGAGELLYSLRVSTNERTVSSDGKFADRLSTSWKTISLFGAKVYERNSGSDIVNRLLFDTRPPRDEDAFCNMYVFGDSKQAKKFQDGTETSDKFDYDVAQSQIGTQSCNGRLRANGKKFIYVGFENARARYDSYIWLEVATIRRTTKYVREVSDGE